MNSLTNSPPSTDLGGGTSEGPVTHRPLLRVPHVLLDIREVHAAVEKLLAGPAFCFDVETVGRPDQGWAEDRLNPRTNSVMWIGLGAHAQTYLIPMGHPHGRVLVPEHTEQVAACLLYPEDDERHWTPIKHKPSWRMVDVPKPTVFAKAPNQLRPAEVFAALEPLMFSDRGQGRAQPQVRPAVSGQVLPGRDPTRPVPRHDHPPAHPQRGSPELSSSSSWSGIPIGAPAFSGSPRSATRNWARRAWRTSAWTRLLATCARTSATTGGCGGTTCPASSARPPGGLRL